MRKALIVTGAALIAAPLALIGLPAWADSACVTASVATYEAAGFSCFVGSIDFSNIVVTTATTGSGTVTLTNFTPFMSSPEEGLTLGFVATTGQTNGTADVLWTYTVKDNVPGSLIGDAFAQVVGNVTPPGTGQITLTENLNNGNTVYPSLNIFIPPSTTGTASENLTPPASMLTVTKDLTDQTFLPGTTAASAITNAFSEVGVPGPTAGAGLPGLILAGGFLFAWRRSRRTNGDASTLLAA